MELRGVSYSLTNLLGVYGGNVGFAVVHSQLFMEYPTNELVGVVLGF